MQIKEIRSLLMRSADCSSSTLLALIKGSPGSQQLPMGTIEFLLNILIGTSEPTLTNVVADVIEKVCPAFVR